MAKAPQIAILGAGIFVRTQYIPRLAEISDLVLLKAIWSRTEVFMCRKKKNCLCCVPVYFVLFVAICFIREVFCVQESARRAVEIAQKSFPGVECKWGDKGLEEIVEDNSILGVAVVLAGQAQVSPSLASLQYTDPFNFM